MLRLHRIGRLGYLASVWMLAGVAEAAGEPDVSQERVAAIGHVGTEGAEPWRANRLRVETARRQLEVEVAELHAIAEAQNALVEYVESGGGADDEGLDRMLCHESTLRPLCAELVETFGK